MIKEYDGINWYGYIRNGKKQYYQNSEHRCLHVYKYQLETGLELDDNMVVHHKDGNKHNNDIDNLVHMFKWCHKSMHGKIHTGKKVSAETRAKLSKANTGRKVSVETRNKLSKIHTGKKVSAETRAKLSKANTGHKMSAETRNKISKAKTGYKMSAETRNKISKSHIGKNKKREVKKIEEEK